jgi:hypothetical protein
MAAGRFVGGAANSQGRIAAEALKSGGFAGIIRPSADGLSRYGLRRSKPS